MFNCLRLECQGDFNVPLEPGCYRTYNHGTCCSVDKICEQKIKQEVCEYGGKSYKIGQRFYSEDPCLVCICQPGFNGSLVEPFCQKIPCYIERLSGYRVAEGCIPVFYGEKGCCPIDWRCPEATDSVLPGDNKADSLTNPGQFCHFGNLTMNIGDKLNTSKESGQYLEWECICRVPPHPICIQKENHQ